MVCEPIVKHVGISWCVCFVSVQDLGCCQIEERKQKWRRSAALALQLLCLASASVSDVRYCNKPVHDLLKLFKVVGFSVTGKIEKVAICKSLIAFCQWAVRLCALLTESNST